MAYDAFPGSSVVGKHRKAILHAGAAILAISVWLPAPALAGTYHATDDGSLRAAIGNANADADASATVILDNDVTMSSTKLPDTTKPITIDTGGHIYTATYQNGSTLSGAVNLNGTAAGSNYTLSGNFQAAGAGAGGNTNGDQGLFANFGKTITNNGTITGGAGGGLGGNGGTGAFIVGASTVANTGTVAGGSAGNGNGGTGVALSSGGSITNSGIVKGGDGSVNGGSGASASSVPNQTIINSGTISGGKGGTGTGGGGVSLTQGNDLNNTGAILGGDGATGGNGVTSTGNSATLSDIIANSSTGTITGGNGTTGNGGLGASLGAFSPTTNDGTITGGNSASAQGGTGVLLRNGSTLTNTGTIQGGTGTAGSGMGIDFGGPGTNATLINSGAIRGGTSNGVLVRSGAGSFTNNGTIEGGAGYAAIADNSLPAFSLVNSGTITAGTGAANAIEMNAPTQTLSLELHRGSVITGNVAANSGVTNILILSGDDDASFDVSAVGPQYQNFHIFQKTGNSTWTLTGTGTAATPWAIAQGTLAIGDGASVIGDIADNATLGFNNSNALTFANAVTGTGGVNQTGGGRTTMTGASSYSGPTNVSGGTLAVNGSITSAVTVASGGTLGGSGTVGATTILSGGAIAPGNSIGTLHINGAFAQNAGSIYQVEVDPTSNASDLILVNGAATIAGGATINVTKNPPGNYRLDAQYTVLTASGGVTGNYTASGDTAVSQYLALRPTTDANNVYLRVVQTGDPASAATTPNQQQTATGTDSLPGTSGVGSAVLNAPDTATTRAAFDALSGEALASAKGVLISSSVLVRDTTFDRLRDVVCTDDQTRRAGCVAAGDGPSLWAQGFGDWGHTFANANAAGVSQTTGGFLAGVDVPVSDWRLGIFGGYSRTDFNAATRASSGASDTYHLGAYGGTLLGDVNLRLGASYSWSGIDTARLVALGTFTNDLRASYNAGTAQVFGEIGRAFQVDRFSLEPFANLAYVGIHTKGFNETGGDAALTSRADTTQDMFTTFGVRPSTDITIGSISAVLRGMAGWRHTFGDITPSSLVSFAGGTAFTVTGAPIAKESGVVEAGVSANLSDRAAIGLTYGGQFSDRATDHAIRGTIAVSF